MPTLRWRTRAIPVPEPAGVVALGPAAHALLARLRALGDEQLASLNVVATRDMLVVLGQGSALPWADGVHYCAPTPGLPSLWLPTLTEPDLPLDLVLANLAGRGARVPFLLWHDPELVLPLDQRAPLDQARLTWVQGEME